MKRLLFAISFFALLAQFCLALELELGDQIGTVVNSGEYGSNISVRPEGGASVFVGEIYAVEIQGKSSWVEVTKVDSGWFLVRTFGRNPSPAREASVHKIVGTAPDLLTLEQRKEHARLNGRLEERYKEDSAAKERLSKQGKTWEEIHRLLPHKLHLDIRKEIVANNPYAGDDILYVASSLSRRGDHREALAMVEGLNPINVTMEFGVAELRIIKARSLYFLGDKAAAGKEMLKDDAYAIPRASHLGWTKEQMSWLREAINAASGAFELD